ncbi:MAG: ArnT family glycosyltransferase [Bacillota bacterium]
MKTKLQSNRNLISIYLILFFIINLLFIENFPYIHSDEAWLSGLTRNMLNQNTINPNYSFFDLYPTTNHSIKLIFNGLQSIFIKIFGYKVLSVRLISLIFSTSSILVFYKIASFLNEDKKMNILFTILFSLNQQFIMTSHMARQDILILFLMLLSIYFLITNKNNIYKISLIIFIGLGIHPNIFFIGLGSLIIYLYRLLYKKIKLNSFIKFTLFNVFTISFYLITSFMINNNFLKGFLNYGKKLGVIDSILKKLINFYYFYYKIFHQISGTYLILNNKIYLSILFLSIIAMIYFIYKNKLKSYETEIFLYFLSINLAIFLLGRYNQTSIIFPMIFIYLFLIIIFKKIKVKRKVKIYLLIALISLNFIFTYKTINKHTYKEDYSSFLNEFNIIEKTDSKILGNLNLEYKFKNRLLDFRNLDYLKENNLTIEKYIEKNNIEYVIIYEEMDYIYRNRPKWNILYGSLDYYPNLVDYLNTDFKLIKEFSSKIYAIRIAKYVNTYPWKVKIYKLKELN